jgi:predicted phage-related endonuclease
VSGERHPTAPTTATLGGSTLPAACGLDPYCSPVRLWLRLTGREDVPETEAMWWGTRDEAAIRERLALVGYPTVPGEEWTSPEARWLVGHTDAHLAPTDRGGGPPVEIKSMAHGTAAVDNAHRAQLLAYLYLTGHEYGLLARRIGHALTVERVEREEHYIALMLELGERFLGYVKRDTPPPASGHPDDRTAVTALYPDDVRDEPIRETKAVRDARLELRRLMEAEKTRRARMEHLRAVIAEHMGEADSLLDREGRLVATWRTVQSRRFDSAALKEAEPELYERWRVPSSSRTFRLA